MMTEISLNILDVAENSTRAGASLVTILIDISSADDTLKVVIADDGCGMTPEQVAKVTDPFFTTRTTRKVGLGVPFFKMAAESSGGSFDIVSEVNVGTTVTAIFGLTNIDRMPLGDITSTMHNLIVYHPESDFYYRYTVNGESFTLDTREIREILGGVPFDVPEVSAYIREYLEENKQEIDKEEIY
ncbi:MAG: sensor histidine kinase [Lachnospiraceae bacterium]|nr:sensor histidine kinase [Lachnospiraceae bacterium]